MLLVFKRSEYLHVGIQRSPAWQLGVPQCFHARLQVAHTWREVHVTLFVVTMKDTPTVKSDNNISYLHRPYASRCINKLFPCLQ